MFIHIPIYFVSVCLALGICRSAVTFQPHPCACMCFFTCGLAYELSLFCVSYFVLPRVRMHISILPHAIVRLYHAAVMCMPWPYVCPHLAAVVRVPVSRRGRTCACISPRSYVCLHPTAVVRVPASRRGRTCACISPRLYVCL